MRRLTPLALLGVTSVAHAASEAPAFFPQLTLLLLLAGGAAYLSFRVGLVPIIGFLLAGVLAGPSALGLIRDPELINAASEIGVILLLFAIGIEFSLERLARIGRLIFVGGGLQVGLVVGLTTLALTALGVSVQNAVFTGCLVALSSTAIVMKLLSDRNRTGSEVGQVSLGILIFQDLAVVVMVLLVPLLGGQGGGPLDVVWALGKAAALVVLTLVFARRVMPRILEAVARTCSQEIFLLTVVAICFGTAFVSSLAGVSLSLGAFLAGLVVSESRFGRQALGEILPLQILFSAAFFLSVGLLLDVGYLWTHLPLVLAALVLVVLAKALTTALGVRLLGYGTASALGAGLLLAQIGEFSFVLERTGRDVGLSPAGLGEEGTQAFIAATVLLMGVTPLLARLGETLGARVSARTPVQAGSNAAEQDTGAAHDDSPLAG
ncbi:cation:proton antiporter, partial [Deinococcus pimensis]|uniref:cation:proton antiporter n=1 Tax=Deinococcus pimensis TaxID=309888 RepID=UPI0005EB6959